MELTPPTLEFAFRICMEFPAGERVRFKPEGMTHTRGFVPVAGGTVEGPRLSGTVIAGSGGDWPRLWDSGLIEFEAHYLLAATDGTRIYVHNRGIACASPETIAAIEQGGRPREAPYCRVAPRFEAPEGPHGWLSRRLFIGTAERRGEHTIFEYYVVN
ncbi:MAG: DUF3237 domain-containing protein [Rhodocyclaceae bacterium]|nr:DUF3237 domain-containing protein [Rhodocyclaceae bacterium]